MILHASGSLDSNRDNLPLTLLGNNNTLGPLCYSHTHPAQNLGKPHPAAFTSQKRGKTVVASLADLVIYLRCASLLGKSQHWVLECAVSLSPG